ncbi:LOW QUALITY PROTEIN: THAP domain-containing protein [Ctenopharyngodon idella]|uniref:LOW QUALITY PROTEIN: THAP domain-containing protein n=1 Tax=Ctenopharyngodon idella TaxID=7959 RepID=UPI00222E8B9D|nr:LOW QUALITY PROTEIN: THAP domain-containing protein [Ctenopharyngodon idella]
MSCAAVNCTNRPSPGSSISFHRFPLGDKDRLHRWMANMRRHDFKPSPYSRICSHHFEDSCFYKNNKGQVCLAKTAVPTKFFVPDSFKMAWSTKLYKRRRNVENYENHEFHTYSLKRDTVKRKFVEEEVVLDEFVKEEDASDPDMDEASGTPVIYPTEICVIAVRHDHCYRSWSSNTACSSTDTTAETQEIESAKKLKHNLNLVLGKIEACRKKMKLKNATIRRLKRKVTSLSSVISELKAKNLIETKKMFRKDLDRGSQEL